MTSFDKDSQSTGEQGNQDGAGQTPAFGQPQSEQPVQPVQAAQPQYGQQQYGQSPQAQQPQQAQPQYGQNAPVQSYGQPQYGQQAQPQQPQFTQQGQFMGGQPSVPQVPPTYSGELGANGQPAFNQPWYGISFGAAVKRFFTKYVDFTGRASKGEFWWPVLMIALVDIILNIITSPMGTVGDYIGYVWRLAIVLPMLAVTTRRIHDSNTAGWWTILPAVLTYGGLGIMYSTINSLDPDILMYQDTSAIDESTLMTIGWGVIAACAGLIIWLVFGVRQSNPLGTRFDKQSQDQGQNPNPMQ